MRTASTEQPRPRTPLIPERTRLAQVHRSHPLQNLTRISQDGNARINWNRTPALSPKDGDKSGAPVIFQDVVHSIGTREADCAEQSSFRGATEWTFTRMPDLPLAVERLWPKPWCYKG